MYHLIRHIVDDGKYFPLKKDFAPSLVTCLARIGGRVVGIYANNPMYGSGAPDVPAALKEARWNEAKIYLRRADAGLNMVRAKGINAVFMPELWSYP